MGLKRYKIKASDEIGKLVDLYVIVEDNHFLYCVSTKKQIDFKD